MVTIQDIAKQCGISSTTVSMVLNNKGDKYHISAATQEKIRETASKLGYVPNINARRLVNREESTYLEIGVLWSKTQRPFFLYALLDVLDELRKQGKIRDMQIIIYPYDSGDLQAMDAFLLKGHFHGLLTYIPEKEDLDHFSSLDYGCPVVNVFAEMKNHSSVSVCSEADGRLACEIFERNSVKNAAILEDREYSPFYKDRKKGFMERAAELGMNCTVYETGHFGDPDLLPLQKAVEQLISRLKTKGKLPEAFFTQNHSIARECLDALEKEGVRVPEEVKIVGFGNHEADLVGERRITLINYPIYEVCTKAVVLLNGLILGEERGQKVVLESSASFSETCPEVK